MRIERIKEELEKARRKAAEWQARAKDLERQLTEQENLEIIQAVRSITASPEELGDILGRIRSMKTAPEMQAAPVAGMPPGMEMDASKILPQDLQNNRNREETDQHENQI